MLKKAEDGPLHQLPGLDVRLMTALQVLQVLHKPLARHWALKVPVWWRRAVLPSLLCLGRFVSFFLYWARDWRALALTFCGFPFLLCERDPLCPVPSPLRAAMRPPPSPWLIAKSERHIRKSCKALIESPRPTRSSPLLAAWDVRFIYLLSCRKRIFRARERRE